MANLTGMDIEQIREMGRRMQADAEKMRSQIVAPLDNLVHQIPGVWRGPDAERFKGWWQNEHRGHLSQVAEQLHGLGQSALNNAHEQEQASGGGGGSGRATGSSAATGHSSGGAVPGPARGAGVAAAAGSGAVVGAATGALPGSHRSWQEVDRAYRANMTGYYGPNGPSRYQCTAWANYRWKELGYKGPIISGNGGDMVDVAVSHGATRLTTPTLGAMASTMSVAPGYGHVMVVEQVMHNSSGAQQIRVSEMNVGGDGIDGHPNEYRSDTILTSIGGGKWQVARTGAVYDMKFAGLPTS